MVEEGTLAESGCDALDLGRDRIYASQPTAAEAASPAAACPELRAVETHTSPKKKKRKRREAVRFGDVEVYSHEPTIAADRVPGDGPSIGLGKLTGVQIRRIDSFDRCRDTERVGVRHLDAAERRSSLVPIHRSQSIDAVELEAELIRSERAESNRAVSPPPRTEDENSASQQHARPPADALISGGAAVAATALYSDGTAAVVHTPLASRQQPTGWSWLASKASKEDEAVSLGDLWW